MGFEVDGRRDRLVGGVTACRFGVAGLLVARVVRCLRKARVVGGFRREGLLVAGVVRSRVLVLRIVAILYILIGRL